MKLLPKSEISKQKAVEMQQHIAEGIKLARRVDTLRDVAAQEEQSLSRFRVRTVEAIQAEIVEKTAERDNLESGNRVLRDERIRLEGPINLVQEWERIKEDKRANEKWTNDLVGREVLVAEKEEEVRQVQLTFDKRESDVLKKEEWAQQVAKESHDLHREASRVASEADDKLRKATRDINERYAILDEKESRFNSWEGTLLAKEAQLKLDEETITNGMKFIADRRKTLERGFAELKRKQNG